MSTESPENVAVSSAQLFKQRRLDKERGEMLTLTSGLTVRIRRPEITRLISKGMIPANLVQVFLDSQGKSVGSMKPEDLKRLLEFQRIVAQFSFLEPKIADEPNYDSGEIAMDDIDERDLEDIWAYVNGGTEAVAMFREQRKGILS